MGTKFSAFTSQTSFGTTDEVVGLVGGANSRLTRKVLLQGAGTPADGQILRYNANLATPTYETVDPRWRVLALGTDYTAAPPTTSTITVTAATVAAAPAGTPVRFKVGGSALYGIVTISSGTTLTIAGPSISTTLTELCLGVPEMAIQQKFFIAGAYAPSTGDKLAAIQFEAFKWMGPPAYLVNFSMSGNTAYATTKPKFNVKVNGTVVSTMDSSNGVNITTAATWVDNTVATISSAAYAIATGQAIEINCTVAGTGTAGQNLSILLVFVRA